jgi:hypothetical protein
MAVASGRMRRQLQGLHGTAVGPLLVTSTLADAHARTPSTRMRAPICSSRCAPYVDARARPEQVHDRTACRCACAWVCWHTSVATAWRRNASLHSCVSQPMGMHGHPQCTCKHVCATGACMRKPFPAFRPWPLSAVGLFGIFGVAGHIAHPMHTHFCTCTRMQFQARTLYRCMGTPWAGARERCMQVSWAWAWWHTSVLIAWQFNAPFHIGVSQVM